jgi:hypothetical protein
MGARGGLPLLTEDGDHRYRVRETLAPYPALPDLRPRVDELVGQISAG